MWIAKLYNCDGTPHHQWPDAVETVESRTAPPKGVKLSKPLYDIMAAWMQRIMKGDGAFGIYERTDTCYTLRHSVSYTAKEYLSLPESLPLSTAIIQTNDGSDHETVIR
jgi:hypothetical protein